MVPRKETEGFSGGTEKLGLVGFGLGLTQTQDQ